MKIALPLGCSLAMLAATATLAEAQHRLDGPEEVRAGQRFEVRFEGEAMKTDLITIVPADSADARYAEYAAPKRNPVTLTAPLDGGAHELRWLRYASPGYDLLTRRPIRVAAIEASLEAPATVSAGSPFEVSWSGPANALDRIVIQDPGSGASSFGHDDAYTKDGSPARLTAPGTPGDYVLRYQAAGSPPRTLAELPLAVSDVEASIDVLSTTTAGRPLEVSWSGPALELDYVSIGTPDAPLHSLAHGYVRRGNPVEVRAPDEPGSYLVSYVSSERVLASAPLEVRPAPRPGWIEVKGATTSTGGDAVELILDASGSMLQRMGERRRIEIARDALTALVRERVPAGTPFALRVFGHREADRCRTDLEMPLAPLEPERAAERIASIEAMNLARTPIARSLELSAEDLATATGERLVVLVTDGEETCDGDPQEAILALRRSGADVRVNIVGFAIDESALERSFERWAEAGGGRYLDVDDADGLAAALGEAIRPGFQVVDFEGRVVATGVIDGDPVEVGPGDYRIRFGPAGAPGEATVHVTGGETTVHTIGSP